MKFPGHTLTIAAITALIGYWIILPFYHYSRCVAETGTSPFHAEVGDLIESFLIILVVKFVLTVTAAALPELVFAIILTVMKRKNLMVRQLFYILISVFLSSNFIFTELYYAHIGVDRSFESEDARPADNMIFNLAATTVLLIIFFIIPLAEKRFPVLNRLDEKKLLRIWIIADILICVAFPAGIIF
jgi:hypothetical protein